MLSLRICEKVSVTAFTAVIDSTIFKAKCLNKLIVSASQCPIINLKIFKRISNHMNDATSMLFLETGKFSIM